jgi:hypothetical protein
MTNAARPIAMVIRRSSIRRRAVLTRRQPRSATHVARISLYHRPPKAF